MSVKASTQSFRVFKMPQKLTLIISQIKIYIISLVNNRNEPRNLPLKNTLLFRHNILHIFLSCVNRCQKLFLSQLNLRRG